MEKNRVQDLKTHCELLYVPKDASPLLFSKQWHAGLTIEDLIQASGFLKIYPEVATLAVGIFARLATRETQVKPGDRIELYRPLLLDPKEKRRHQAKRKSSSEPRE